MKRALVWHQGKFLETRCSIAHVSPGNHTAITCRGLAVAFLTCWYKTTGNIGLGTCWLLCKISCVIKWQTSHNYTLCHAYILYILLLSLPISSLFLFLLFAIYSSSDLFISPLSFFTCTFFHFFQDFSIFSDKMIDGRNSGHNRNDVMFWIFAVNRYIRTELRELVESSIQYARSFHEWSKRIIVTSEFIEAVLWNNSFSGVQADQRECTAIPCG